MPEDDRNLYSCTDQARHLSPHDDAQKYKIRPQESIGGVLAIKSDYFKLINGYSNEYWGWGGEDNDIGRRVLESNLTIVRPNSMIGRYRMMKHVKRVPTESRWDVLASWKDRWRHDGLLYSPNITKVIKVVKKKLYFHLTVDVGKMPQTSIATTAPLSTRHTTSVERGTTQAFAKTPTVAT